MGFDLFDFARCIGVFSPDNPYSLDECMKARIDFEEAEAQKNRRNFVKNKCNKKGK